MKSNQKKIRDLQRILRKLQQSVPEDRSVNDDENVSVKIAEIEDKIRELAAMKENNIQKEIKRKHESKYHMVKFFERRKITRKIHKVINALKKSENGEEGKEKMERLKARLEDDLTYIM